ncbi:SRPBCC family protein [Herminiimonas fonticola]|uniref:Polyketide cyclase/dehydrase/lipid transport protein n=1 Tax=Herminiimonas fonticola TaxID=303380 RepID=A0A4R6GH84_9BURK|nr:SRPBCC family protein [Herminiimonas fonticola]RBA25215.1 Polyketide cyclase / dehydrase and lipid transport [Herminiimonas fonticola]TDN94331.1 polyketide cyclase/dehydrase/lipid transport protein [Herminiimonas fonticola]
MTDGKPHLVAAWILSILLLAHMGTASYAHAANETNARSQFSVEATRYGDAVQVSVRTTVKAPLALIWNTLTDYNHLEQFIPGMNKSRLIERQGKVAVVEQSGYAHLWFFHFPIDVTVEVTEHPFSTIQARLLKGNLKRLEGHYEIEKIADDHYALRWSGTIEPGVAVPGFLATDLMRKNISEQFLGMVDEIERRAALATPTSPLDQETILH